MHHITKNN